MTKKILLPLIFIFGVVFLVSCGDTSSTEDVSSNTEQTSQTPTTDIQTTDHVDTDLPTLETFVLPDLDGYLLDDIENLLSEEAISYRFVYQTNLFQTDGLFIEYGDGYSAGDLIQADDTVSIHLYAHDVYLPDLTGMTQSNILDYFFSVGITDFNFSVVNDNTVEDETFVGYDGSNIGDLLPSGQTIEVLIGFNDPVIPQLDGLIKRQIANLLTELDINYTFSYLVDDAYPEDTFAAYTNVNVGDFYQDDSVVIDVVLYQNTFTNSDSSLMISKYVDSETDSAIELFNPTDAPIDLSDYEIVIYLGGSYLETYRIPLGDNTLASGDTFLITSTTTEPNLQRYADIRSDDLSFDGVNDTIQLVYKNGTYIDTIYQIGDRGSEMDNEIFVRRQGVVSGNRTFNLGEWTSFVPDYYEIVINRQHPIDIVDVLTYSIQDISAFVVNGFDSPYGGMDLVSYEGVADGDTAYFSPGFLMDERVRFIGNDTPETSPAVVDEPEAWGLGAKAYTKTILEYADNNNKNIYVQSDPDIGFTEGYGRHLGLIWVNLEDDVLSIDIKNSSGEILFTEELSGMICINYLLVKNGFSADEYSSTSSLTINNRYMFRWFDEAERFAKMNNLGVHEQ